MTLPNDPTDPIDPIDPIDPNDPTGLPPELDEAPWPDAGDVPAAGAAHAPSARRSWGFLLIGIGALMFLDRALPNVTDLAWTAVMLGAGFLFIRMWRSAPDEWWPLIPGLALLALGTGRLLDILRLDPWGGALAGSLLFVGLGSAFVIVYLRDRAHWWAVIPAGALLGLAGAAFFGSAGAEGLAGASLFIGLGAAFLWLLAVERMGWAIFPAGAMAALAVVVLGEEAGVRVPAGFRGFDELVWPAFLIAVGAWLLLRKGREEA